jgi:hypothetical protein
MVKAKHIIVVAGILAGGMLVALIFWQSEEAKIRKQFEFIAEKFEKTPGESPIMAAAKANQIREVSAERCRVDAPAYSAPRDILSDELPGIFARIRSEYSAISLTFHDFVIEFPEQDTAKVNVTVIMEGELASGDPIEDFHELECILEKIDEVWRFKEVEVVEVLRK